MDCNTLKKLAQNPHYRLSPKQVAQLRECTGIHNSAVPIHDGSVPTHPTLKTDNRKDDRGTVRDSMSIPSKG